MLLQTVPNLPKSIRVMALCLDSNGYFMLVQDSWGQRTEWGIRDGVSVPLPEKDILNIANFHVRYSMGWSRRN